MANQLWINLPVKDMNKAKAFFSEIGFRINTRNSGENSTCLLFGEGNTMVMLFPEETFKNFSQNEISDTGKSTEVLFSVGAASREEVDELAEKVTRAGGNLFAKPSEVQGWMYGCGFADPDGHRWNILYMDHSKLPQQ